MPCFYPLTAYRTANGEIRFDEKGQGRPMQLPCGQCHGCRIERSKQWATRCVHEASMHKDNCFITLTYNDEHVPPDGSLIKSDFQKFIKRLRKKIHPKKVRYYMCGEYGDKNNRPHYHAILFGFNFDDWTYLFDSPSGHSIYTSPTLEKIWQQGFVTIGEVTFESAAYIARYVLKKLNGKIKDQVQPETGLKPYERYNSYTGEITEVLPEYATMSRRPGIAHNWISTYTSDVYPKDFTTVRGTKKRPPKYYDRVLEQINPDLYDDIKAGRNLKAYESEDNTPSRLKARETVAKAKHKTKKRSL